MNFKKILPNFSDYKNLPSWPQWKQIPQTLSTLEKSALVFFVVLLLSSASFLSYNYYLQNTTPKPARGGTFIEGAVGQPRFINPIYISSNDIDRALVQLTFSGLMRYNKQGEITYDLAKSYHTEQGKVWTVTLKKDITWQDGEPITADDIIFTINAIQNSDYKSPQRINWMGVKVSKVSPRKVKFKLDNEYPHFLENLTLKLIPKHRCEGIAPADFSLSSFNLKPIGSGPYQVESINREGDFIKSLTLIRNPNYHQQPYLNQIKFRFFKNQKQLVEAAQKESLNGISVSTSTINSLESFNEHQFSLPRYFAVFFNPDQSEILSDKKIRKALNYATNKKQIIKEVTGGQAGVVNSPILPSVYGFEQSTTTYNYNLEKANKILDEQGFKLSGEIREKTKDPEFQFSRRLQVGSEGEEVKKLQQCLVKEVGYDQEKVTSYFGNLTKQAAIKFQEKYQQDVLQPWGLSSGTGVIGESTRSKLNKVCFEHPKQPLTLELTLVNQSEMKQIAQTLKEQWKQAGINLKLKTVSLSELKNNYIKPRNYEALLFGESLGVKPDLYSFWHSSQTEDPGLNLAKFESEQADKLLEKARQTLDSDQRAKYYQEFQQLVINEAPAVFLYNPSFTYYTSKVRGVTPSLIVDSAHRFISIKDWYLKTKRVWR